MPSAPLPFIIYTYRGGLIIYTYNICASVPLALDVIYLRPNSIKYLDLFFSSYIQPPTFLSLVFYTLT